MSSSYYRAAVLTAWIIVAGLLVSWVAPAAIADQDGVTTKAPKKVKSSKSATAKKTEKADEKKADEKKTAEKKPAEKKPEKYDEFDDDDAKPSAKESTTAAKTAKSSETKPAKPTKVVRLTLKGEYPEGPTDPGMFADLQPSLSRLIELLDEAKADKEVAAVWLRIDDLELGRGKVNEVRAAIAGLRKTGKPVYAELTSAETGAYLVASACDFIYMPVSGTLVVPGVRMEVTYYKGLLDKLGLKFDALRMGKYKGFVEPMSRETMSGPVRESLQAIVDDAYDGMIAWIAKDRHLEDYQVKSLVDKGLFTATDAKDAGLIDEVLYADEFEASLGKRLKLDHVDIDSTYKKKQLDTDFSGIGGFVKLMEAFSGGKKSTKASNKQKIALVYAVGEITEGKSASSLFGGSTLGSTTMVETLNKAFGDPKVVAVVLRIDSPGGSATASDLIWRSSVRVKKPFVASMGNVAGSGGYYIAMGAQKIYAEPQTITGSIGVGGGKLVTGGLYGKLGVNTEVISRGKNSGAFSTLDSFSEEERKVWTNLLQQTYHEFVSKAAAGRKMNYDKIEALAQGRVYTGQQAKKLGLIDEIGTLKDALAEAKKLASLKPDADIEIEVLPKPKPFFEQLFGEGLDADEFTAALPDSSMSGFVKTIRQAALWRKLLGGKVFAWMPYRIELK
jgi:protease IV